MSRVPRTKKPDGPPGWYEDPLSADHLRYFDGRKWTDAVLQSQAGPALIDEVSFDDIIREAEAEAEALAHVEAEFESDPFESDQFDDAETHGEFQIYEDDGDDEQYDPPVPGTAITAASTPIETGQVERPLLVIAAAPVRVLISWIQGWIGLVRPNGRSGPHEFVSFNGANFVLASIAADSGYSLAFVLFAATAAVALLRRMHDIGLPVSYIRVMPLQGLFLPGTAFANQFGPPPDGPWRPHIGLRTDPSD